MPAFFHYYRSWLAVCPQVFRHVPFLVALGGYTVGPPMFLLLKLLISTPFLRRYLTKLELVHVVRPAEEGSVDPDDFEAFTKVWYDGGAASPAGLDRMPVRFAAAREHSVWFEMLTTKLGPLHITMPAAFAQYDPHAPAGVFDVTLHGYHPHMMLGHVQATIKPDHLILELNLLCWRPFAPLLRWIVANLVDLLNDSLRENWPAFIASRPR